MHALECDIRAWLGQALGGLAGLSIALALTTFVALTVMLRRLHAAAVTLSAFAGAALTVALIASIAFLLPLLGLGSGPAAVVGLALYAGTLLALRPAGLRSSWRYLRSLT